MGSKDRQGGDGQADMAAIVRLAKPSAANADARNMIYGGNNVKSCPEQ